MRSGVLDSVCAPIGRRWSRASVLLARDLAQQRAGDDEPLDLRGALVDLRDLGVAVVALGRGICSCSRSRRAPGSPRRSRAGRRAEANSLACAPSTVCGARRSSSRAARQVSARAASISVCMSASFCWIAWCAPIGLPNVRRSLRVADGEVERRLRDPDRLRGDPDPSAVERHSAIRRPVPARSRGARRACRRSAMSAVLEEFRPSFSSSRSGLEARRAAPDDERARPVGVLREDDEDVRVRAVGDPLLGARQACSRRRRACCSAPASEPAAGLGQREGSELMALGERRHEALDLTCACRGR